MVDTTGGTQAFLSLKASVSITSAVFSPDLALVTATPTTIPIGGLAAIKVLAGFASVATTLKVSGGSESTYILLGPWLLTNTTGTWTSATLTQSSGATVNDDVLAAG